MSDDKQRAIDLANKLLRLAAPSGGSTEAERTNAALHAAKIISENGLVVAAPAPKVRRRAPQQHPSRSNPPRNVYQHPVTYTPKVYAQYGEHWTIVEVATPCPCVMCHRQLNEGDPALYSMHHGYRCYDITCDEAA